MTPMPPSQRLFAAIAPKAVRILALATSIGTLAMPALAAPPVSTVNPFNARAVTNAAVSPTNPPTISQIRRERAVRIVNNLTKVNQANLQEIDTNLSELTERIEELQNELDDLDKRDPRRDDLEEELEELEEQIEELGALQTVYQRNLQFLGQFLRNFR